MEDNKTAFSEALDALRHDDPSGTLDYHSWVLSRSHALCVTVPKVACSRVKTTLHQLDGGEQPEHAGWIHDQGQCLASFTTSEMVEILTSPRWFRFCIVRNPYERLLSAYKTQIANTWNDEYLWLKEAIKSKFGYPRARGEDRPEFLVAFRDLVRFLRDGDRDAAYDGHFNVQSRILRLDLIEYDFVGRFENFQADFATALRHISAPDDVIKTVEEVMNWTYRIHPAIAYDKELADAVFEIYEDDFTNFDYDRDSWMHESSFHESRMTTPKEQ
jgi:hypothetical protein